jgi:hypothetical protein
MGVRCLEPKKFEGGGGEIVSVRSLEVGEENRTVDTAGEDGLSVDGVNREEREFHVMIYRYFFAQLL